MERGKRLRQKLYVHINTGTLTRTVFFIRHTTQCGCVDSIRKICISLSTQLGSVYLQCNVLSVAQKIAFAVERIVAKTKSL